MPTDETIERRLAQIDDAIRELTNRAKSGRSSGEAAQYAAATRDLAEAWAWLRSPVPGPGEQSPQEPTSIRALHQPPGR